MSITDGLSLGANSLMGSFGQATLSLENAPFDAVSFQYNPASIAISHSAPMRQSNGRGTKAGKDGDSASTASMNTYDEQAKANGTTTITMRGLTFDGPKVAATCMKLLKWSQFDKVTDAKRTQATDLPRLKFMWGSSQTYIVNLNQVTINYNRFSRFGKPIRASVDLTLHMVPKDLLPTNPSSGGMGGRRTHMLTGAETLPELATRTYGRPDRWREIAVANGIGDPLRVKPGTYVYLPGEQEGDE